MVQELQQQLASKKVTITLSPSARSWLAREGYEPAFGARPLRRLIMKEIGDVLTEEILFGSLAKGGKVEISRENNQTTFSYL
jgi:ATP-dependent Clp protease ATP-binding subunit ClpA